MGVTALALLGGLYYYSQSVRPAAAVVCCWSFGVRVYPFSPPISLALLQSTKAKAVETGTTISASQNEWLKGTNYEVIEKKKRKNSDRQ